jgi:hypothetical protein
MPRSFTGFAALVIVAVLFASSPARAKDLFDFLNSSNKVLSCSPQELHDDSILTIEMPKKHGDFLVIDEPTHGDRVYVVYPKPRWPLKMQAEKFRKLPSVSWKVRDIKGVFSTVRPAFWVTGRYTMVVGSGFDTPTPVIDGWCEVDYDAADPPRPFESLNPGEYTEGQAWNKMKCTPSVVGRNSVITINLPFPHGPYFSIYREGHYSDASDYLIFPSTGPFSRVEGGNFMRMRLLSIGVGTVKVQSSNGKWRHVFVKPGRYMISLNPAAETDNRVIEGWCVVTFRG